MNTDYLKASLEREISAEQDRHQRVIRDLNRAKFNENERHRIAMNNFRARKEHLKTK